jgi:hypothetical protein
MKKSIIVLFACLIVNQVYAQNCKSVAQFSSYACSQITQDMCLASANPATCAVAAILAWDESDWGNKLVERGVGAGCTYTVEKTSQGYKVVVEGAKSAVDNFLYEFKKYVLKDNWMYYTSY